MSTCFLQSIRSLSNCFVNCFVRMVLAGVLYVVGVTAVAQSVIPFKREPVATGAELSRLGVGMAVTIVVLGVALYLVRRHLRMSGPVSGPSQQLRILETQRLGPHATLHVMHFAGHQYLIGHSEQGLACLASAALPDNAGKGPADAQP
jgi:flagellar biogenesis protein FliO